MPWNESDVSTIAAENYPNGKNLVAAMNSLAATFPDVATRFDIALEGLDHVIPGLRVGRTRSAEAPAMLVVGNLHPAEVLGSVAAVEFARALAEHMTTAEHMTAAGSATAIPFDDFSVLVLPRVAMLTADEFLRGPFVPRGVDDVESQAIGSWIIGDHDGNGRILDIRFPDPDGRWRPSALDDALLMPRRPGDRGVFYEVKPEGWWGSPGTPPVDVNRDFPADWRPHPWAGSEPCTASETRALIEFVRSRPEIAMALDLHTHAGCGILPSGISTGPFYDAIHELVRRVFDYPMDEVDTGGSFIHWLWEERGIPAVSIEMYGPHYLADVLSRREVWRLDTALDESSMARFLHWLRKACPGAVHPWRPARDTWPSLPDVEVGGIDRRFTIINPPPGPLLDCEVSRFIRFGFEFLDLRPRFRIEVETAAAHDEKDNGYTLHVRPAAGLSLAQFPALGEASLQVHYNDRSISTLLPPLPAAFDFKAPNWFNVAGSAFHPPPIKQLPFRIPQLAGPSVATVQTPACRLAEITL